uniref:Uncharacterized protein n=1 Tax=Noctiluca scintillans TaxID=2966 RepID=A0A7S1AK46_NOCSC|mmetsp:Transcript_47924/g.126888  ORF Transcript_47924/g.126888 Transcript_47924/m.126888 type:complete len:456 (+) Transcript_47924:46-1413(+)
MTVSVKSSNQLDDVAIFSPFGARRKPHFSTKWSSRKLERQHEPRPAHLAAALAIILETDLIRAGAVCVYRWMSLIADMLLLSVTLWTVKPLPMLALFFFLWYIPAGFRSGFISPIIYPIFNFVDDDHSLLGLHAGQRSVVWMYCWKMFRVSLLLVAEWVARTFNLAPRLMRSDNFKKDWFPEHILFSRTLWTGLRLGTKLIAAIWMVITFFLLACPCLRASLNGVPDEPRLQRIATLMREVQRALHIMEPRECRAQLCKLRDRHKYIVLLNIMSAHIPVFVVIAHSAADMFSFYLLIEAKSYSLALLLLICECMKGVLIFYEVGWDACWPFHEAILSWNRGLPTNTHTTVVRCDRGVVVIPMLFVKMYGLPRVAKYSFSAIIGVCSIISMTFNLANFVFTEFDLGTEREGRHTCHRFDGSVSHTPRDSSITGMSGVSSLELTIQNSTDTSVLSGL